MLKLIAGNVAFALMVWGWYYYCGGPTTPFKAGAVAIFIAFLIGTGFGIWLAPKPKKPNKKPAPPPKPSSKIDAAVFDRIS